MKKILVFIISITASIGVSAGSLGAGVTMHNWSDIDSGFGDLSVNIPTLNFTYENRLDNNLAYQVKIGFGLSDDSDNDDDGDSYEFKFKNLIQLKGMYFFGENVYGAATYTRYDAEFYSEYYDESSSESDNDFGFLLGYKLDNLDFHVGPTYSDGDSGDILEFGFTYFF
jgi:hypothetical protein